ncbi:hypothetical protein CEQ90_02115 [Lewinellaceae bacterium SD302]|nr:hypothetical protein CEQ90_02115 [Lewinellaceae bacterium SD302]
MRYTYSFFLFLFLVASAAGQTSLKGKVTDQDSGNEGMPFASVALKLGEKIIQGVNTDLDGNYLFKSLNPGVYNLEVSYTGYATQRLTGVLIKAGQVNVVNVTMSAGVSLDEVMVTGYKVPLIDQDNTTQGKTVSSEEIRNLPTRSINAISATTAGVGAADSRRKKRRRKDRHNKEAIQPAAVPIRGNRSNSGNYYVDGIRVHGKLDTATPVDADNPEPRNDEQYNEITENEFIATEKEAISTLSTDVDRAAYANVRGLINAGQEVPKDAVRIEEMINYFRYSDPFPKGKDPVAIRTELTECPWNKDNQLLRIGVRARGMAPQQAPASNVVFLVDVSGSMNSANKLPLVTKALKMLASNLRQEDKVSIVVYAGAAGLVLPPTSGANTPQITAVLDNLRARGSTAGGAGIELAYKTARENFIKGGNNRIILVTDGDFNVGTSDQESLVKLIEKERESGVFLTVIGCGRGNIQDGTMQELADRGNGNHGYLDSYAEARKLLVDEFGGTVYTVAKDVKLQLEFDPERVAGYRLIGYENRLLATEDFDDDTKDAAEMGAGHVVTVLYEIEPAKKKRSQQNDLGELRLRYKQPNDSISKKMTWQVGGRVAGFSKASEDLRWGAAVAEFGLLLRDSKFKGEANWEDLAKRTKAALGADPFGYRKEMLGLIELVKAR